MKKIPVYLLIIPVLFFLLLILTGQIGAHIGAKSSAGRSGEKPNIPTRNDIEVFKLETGYAQTLEGFMLAGGSMFTPAKAMHNAVFIRHPKGNLLIDTGIGKDVDEQYKDMPLWSQPIFAYTRGTSAGDTLQSKGIAIDRIILTHMHWDHASGIEEFPEAEVYTSKEEYQFAMSDNATAPAFLKSQYDGNILWKHFALAQKPYEIFAESLDFYADGSIIIVKLPGHSPGSIGIFVNLSPQRRYFFTGDLTWTVKALKNPAHKYILSSMIVDYNRNAEAEKIQEVSDFLNGHPEIIPVPSHDATGYESIKLMQ